MTGLRPIGTVYKEEHGPDQSSTDPRGNIMTYRVMRHVWTSDLSGRTVLAELIHCIDIEYLPVEETVL